MDTLTLFATHVCNQRCSFCCDPPDSAARFLPVAAAEDACREALLRGARRLVLLGGEPTLHPQLSDIIGNARKLGFSVVQIVSNGRRLKDRSFVAELKAAGLDGVGISVHGAAAKTHERLTQRRGSHGEVRAALAQLTECGLWISSNTVVTRSNYMECKDIVAMLLGFAVIRAQFAVMNPASIRGEVADLAISPAEVAPWLCGAVRFGREKGFLCIVEGMPLCLMPGLESHAAEATLPALWVADPGRGPDLDAFSWRADKGRASVCATCNRHAQCAGTYPEYFTLFPDLVDHLHPARRESEAS